MLSSSPETKQAVLKTTKANNANCFIFLCVGEERRGDDEVAGFKGGQMGEEGQQERKV